ncbi:MAG: glycosyl hydrolase [Armatimonadetes bacterium]|nr:glycosyl hydrolase [Armatimonadota bacterium]
MTLVHRALAVLALAAPMAALAAPARPANPGYKRPISFEALRGGFAQPDMLYAPFAFWFWDEPIQAAKMTRMAARMAEGGMNPGYAHARMSMVGTPPLPGEQWLGDLWFKTFGAALGEAEKRGAYLGYCDEYWWPSFQANGRVLNQHPGLKAVSLAWKCYDVKGGAALTAPSSLFVSAAKRLEPAPDAGETPAETRLGRWIWHPEAQPIEHRCWFRKRVDVPADRPLRRAAVRITADNAFRLFIDGREAAASDDWHVVQEVDITARMAPGPHTVAVEARNVDGGFGLTAGVLLDFGGGRSQLILTDGSWRTSLQAAPGWSEPGFDDSGWRGAAVIAEAGAAPWNLSPGPADLHVPATIRSASLRVIGGGKPFRWTAPAGSDWRVYAFTLYDHAGVDGGQVNCLDPKLAPAFIQIALEPYARRMAGKMGKGIPGDFIDHEGAYGWRLAWSDALAARYKSRYGADLRALLPLMADVDAEGFYPALRWRWYDLVSELYSGQFAQVTAWHEKRGMYTTAHVWEESLPAQAYAVGDHMRLLRSLTMPGQDCLGTKAVLVHDFKEVASVAEFGGRRAVTELMGAGGWGVMTPGFLKQSINACTAWGMGHVIPHAVFAQRKLTGNPWMPDFYESNPMFPWLRVWNDFVRRTSYVNSHCHAVPDVLLYNPLEILWTLADHNLLHAQRNLPGLVWTWPEDNANGRRANAIDRAYSKAMQDLTDARVEFLIGDRHYLGGMQVRGGKLVTGPFAFGAVALPPLEVLPLAVARKLAAFAEAGGRVYALGELPRASAERGVADPEMAALMARLAAARTFTQCPAEPAATRSRWEYGPGSIVEGSGGFGLAPLLAAGAPGLTSPVSFEQGGFAMLQRRMNVDGRDLYWLANNTGKAQECRLHLAGARGAAELWDAETGATRLVASRRDATGSRVTLRFGPYEGFWLAFDPKRAAVATERGAGVAGVVPVTGPWTVRCEPGLQPVVDDPVAAPAEFAAGVEKPLEDWSRWMSARFSGVLTYRTTVILNAQPGMRLTLDLGTVHHAAAVTVNGKPCGARIWAPHTVDITDAARPGANVLEVRVANLANNSYGDLRPSGLIGPVSVWVTVP